MMKDVNVIMDIILERRSVLRTMSRLFLALVTSRGYTHCIRPHRHQVNLFDVERGGL